MRTLGKYKKRWPIIIILCLVSILFLGTTFMANWWHLHSEWSLEDESVEIRYQYSIDGFDFNGNAIRDMDTHVDFRRDSTEEFLENQARVFLVTSFMIIIVIILLLSSICASVVVFFTGKFGKVASFLLISAMIISILVPLFFGLALPRALEKDQEDNLAIATEKGVAPDFFGDPSPAYNNKFAGSYEVDNHRLEWGPLIGWYITIMAFLMISLCALLSFFPGPKHTDFLLPNQIHTGSVHQTEQHRLPDTVETISSAEKTAIKCPSCGQVFKLELKERPVQIQCPFCQTAGEIK